MKTSITLHLNDGAGVSSSGLHERHPGGWVTFAGGEVWPWGEVNIHANDLRQIAALGLGIADEAERLMAEASRLAAEAARPARVAAEDHPS